MGAKEKKPNTPSEVQRRIGKLEQHLIETVQFLEAGEIPRKGFPEYKFNPTSYESAVVQFLQNKGVPLNVNTVRRTLEVRLLPDGNKPIYSQPKLDVMERSFRLASKVLQIAREIDDPTPYVTNILRALSPLDDIALIEHANRISDIFTKDKEYNFTRSLFTDKLPELLNRYNIPQLDGQQNKPKRDYFTALDTFLDIAAKFAEKYGRKNLTEDQKISLINDLGERIAEEVYGDRKRKKSDGPEFDLDYLTGLAKMGKVAAITQLQSDFGILVGMDYQGNPRKGKSVAEFYFLRLDGREAKYFIDSRGKAPSPVKALIEEVLLELVENNHKGIVLREESKKRDGRETFEIKTSPNPDLAKKLAHYQGRLEGTRKSADNLARYF